MTKLSAEPDRFWLLYAEYVFQQLLPVPSKMLITVQPEVKNLNM
ncbi:MAG: hypothetical protein ACJ70T_00660 [Nitrososphaera sp.]